MFPSRRSASLYILQPCAHIYLLAAVSVHFWTTHKYNEQEWFETFLVGFLKISALLALALTHASRIRLTVSGSESSLRGTTLVRTFRQKSPVGMPAVLCYFKLCIFSSILFYRILKNDSKKASVPSTIMYLQFTSHFIKYCQCHTGEHLQCWYLTALS